MKRAWALLCNWINYMIWVVGMITILEYVHDRFHGLLWYVWCVFAGSVGIFLAVFFWNFFFKPLIAELRKP